MSKPPLDRAGLEALRQAVPHCTIADVAEIKEGADPKVIEDIAAYLHHFAKPEMPGTICLRCQRPLMGSLVEQLIGDGGFEWGLVHGRGHCKGCGWPAAGHHFIKDRDGNELLTIRNFVLQDHPDDIELRT